MLAQDFARRVALEPFRPGVPADHPAVSVQHIDGVVGDGVDQQPIAILLVDRVASRILGHSRPLAAPPPRACGGRTTYAAVWFPEGRIRPSSAAGPDSRTRSPRPD